MDFLKLVLAQLPFLNKPMVIVIPRLIMCTGQQTANKYLYFWTGQNDYNLYCFFGGGDKNFLHLTIKLWSWWCCHVLIDFI